VVPVTDFPVEVDQLLPVVAVCEVPSVVVVPCA
jgi:hypothetical protein